MAHTKHSFGPDRRQNRRALALALALTASFTVVEVVGGILTGSLALLADAGHMLSDNFSLALALGAIWLAGRPPSSGTTFGYKRAEVLAALVNGLTLVAISVWIFIEAYGRLSDPPDVLGGWMLVIAVAGLLVNLGALTILHRGEKQNLNMAAASRHVFADLLGSLGVIVAAAIILLTDWLYADPVVSVLVGLLILASAYGVLRDSLRVLLEATPSGINAEQIGRRMAAADGVEQVHDLHVWTITSGFPALSAHVLVPPGEDCHQRRRELDQLLRKEFGIDHSTLQVEHSHAHDLVQIERQGRLNRS